MKRWTLILALSVFAGCGPTDDTGRTNSTNGGTNGRSDGGADNCIGNKPADSDGDGISDKDEDADESPPRDTDRDGTPDFQDQDSDNDEIPDSIEARNGGSCAPPVDSDQDGKADFRDLDSDDANDGTIPDTAEAGADYMAPIDTDGNGAPDYMDADNDGDNLLDIFELVPSGQSVAATQLAAAPDTDLDGIPDFRDQDSDGDSIADATEGMVDTDGDLTGNWRDLDADGVRVPDAAEAGDLDLNTDPLDTDMDAAPDFQDRDSDNDGLTDGKEDKSCDGVLNACESNRLLVDTDGDTITDIIEYQDCFIKPASVQLMTNCQCDATDPAKSPRTRGDFVFVSDFQVAPVPDKETLNLTTDVGRADVVFMIDTTASMGPCADNIAANIGAMIVPGVRAKVKDVAFGLFTFRDFLDPFVVQYDYRIQTVRTPAALDIANTNSIAYALDQIATGNGFDFPEAGWEALYTVVADPAAPRTAGAGSPKKWTSNINALKPASVLAGEEQGTVVQGRFRAGAVPIIVAVGDSNWHDSPNSTKAGEDGIDYYGGPNGDDCNATDCANAPSRQEAIDRVNAIGGHVIGLAVTGGSGDPKTRLRSLAQATTAIVKPSDFPAGRCTAGQCCTGSGGAAEAPLGGTDCPLSYTITRSGSSCPASEAIVDGISSLANALQFDVHVVASDVDPGTVDNFIDKLVPNVSGMGPAAMCVIIPAGQLVDNFVGPKALPNPAPPNPADGVNDTFIGLSGAVQICFDVVAKQNNVVMNTSEPQIFRAQLQVIGETKTNNMTNSFNLGTPREVFFLVPPVIVNGPIG
jgi:hypothetical protein